MNKEDKMSLKSLESFDFSENWDEKPKPKVKNEIKKTFKTKKLNEKIKKKITKKLITQIIIEEQIVSVIKKQLLKDALTRTIDEIAQTIYEKKAYSIIAKHKDESKMFYVNKKSNEISFTRSEAVRSLFLKNNIIDIKIVREIEINNPPQYVLKCDLTNKLFPPQSHNLYENIIESEIIKNHFKYNKETLVSKQKRTTEDSDVEEFVKSGIQEVVFMIEGIKKEYQSIDILMGDMENKYFNNFFAVKNKIKINVKKMTEEMFTKRVVDELPEKRVLLSKIKNCLTSIFKKTKYDIQNINGQSYICAYRKNKVDLNSLNDISKKILLELSGKKNLKTKILIEAIKDSEITGIDVLKQIKWLATEGIIKQFTNGKIISNTSKL